MVPPGHVALVYCDTRLAEGWRAAFAADGIDAVVVETVGDDMAKGAYAIYVPRRKLVAANAVVTAVTQGRRRLPAGRPGGRAAVAAIVIVALALGGAALRLF